MPGLDVAWSIRRLCNLSFMVCWGEALEIFRSFVVRRSYEVRKVTSTFDDVGKLGRNGQAVNSSPPFLPHSDWAAAVDSAAGASACLFVQPTPPTFVFPATISLPFQVRFFIIVLDASCKADIGN